MKIPALDLVAIHAKEGNEALCPPAVAAVFAGGFLLQAAPVALLYRRGKEGKRPYLLLTYEQRCYVAQDEWRPMSEIFGDRAPGEPDRFAWLRPSGQRGNWHNAENLWIDAEWLKRLLAALPSPCNAAQLLAKLVEQVCP